MSLADPRGRHRVVCSPEAQERPFSSPSLHIGHTQLVGEGHSIRHMLRQLEQILPTTIHPFAAQDYIE